MFCNPATLIAERDASQVEALPGPLADALLDMGGQHVREELPEAAQGAGHQPALSSGPVQVFRNGDQPYPMLIEDRDGVQQDFQIPSPAVSVMDNHYIKLPLSGIRQELTESL